MKKLPQWITQKMAAEIAGKTLGAVHQLVRTGRLRISRRNDKTLVRTEDVVNFKPIKTGRPPKGSLGH